jgi:phage minor structural protein
MYPILYESIEAGIVPQHNGLGILSDAISCYVEQERNGIYELTMEYAASGIHAEDIALRRIIKVKPNPTDAPQLFRIDRISKVMNNRFTVFGKHISYDLSGYEITSGTASSAAGACALLQSKASGYSITTDKTTTGNFKIDTPASVRSYFGGKEGSFLDVFGTAEIKYDNFHIQFLLHAGEDRGVTIRYKKNLLELSQEIDMNNLYTHVICFFKNENAMVVGEKVATGLELDVPRTLTVDVSGEYPNTPPTVAQLTARATTYISQNNLTVPTNNIKLDFVQSGELANRVDLCDTVTIYYEALGITRANCKCIRTRYDCIREKYTETEFGDVQSNLTDTIVNASKSLAEKPSTSAMANAITHATEMITGNLGGYVILHDSNGDGKPDEILIMNTENPETSTEIWRWNKNGLGFANSYDGNYETAITQDGQIVADFITAGVLNASIIKAGILSDVNSNSTIDMTSGIAKLKNMLAKLSFKLVDTNEVTKVAIEHTGGQGTRFRMYESNTNALVDLWAYGGAGAVNLNNSNGNQIASMGANDYGGVLNLSNSSGIRTARLMTATNGGGYFSLHDNSSNQTIYAYGSSGNIYCVKVNETSSIKVKKNVKPIEDAEKILELQAVSFDYKDENRGTDQRGFIAEDVAKIIPNLVSDGETPSIHYTGMIPYLQDVIKKQQKKIDELESKLNAIIEKIGG